MTPYLVTVRCPHWKHVYVFEIDGETARAVAHPDAPVYDTETLRNDAKRSGGMWGRLPDRPAHERSAAEEKP